MGRHAFGETNRDRGDRGFGASAEPAPFHQFGSLVQRAAGIKTANFEHAPQIAQGESIGKGDRGLAQVLRGKSHTVLRSDDTAASPEANAASSFARTKVVHRRGRGAR